MSSKSFWALLSIILIAFWLRFYHVTDIPPSLNWDEVSIGYNAFSILKTGQDEWGQFLPLHFRSYGEYKLPVQIYASIPGIALFGLNEFGVRITPVVYGTLSVVLLYFLVQLLFHRVEISLLSALLLGISPWHTHLTRASFEASFALFWILLGLTFFVRGLKSPWYLVYSIIPFIIGIYTYNSTRVFIPIFLVALLIIYFKKITQNPKVLISSCLLFLTLVSPLIPFVVSGEAGARYKLVSIIDDLGLVPRINEARGNSTLPYPLPRLIHNKITYVSFYIAEHYLAHFSPDFLFISGAPHKQHHVQGLGQLYFFQAPFLLFGLYLLFKKKLPFRGLLISWLLLSFIPVAVTNDSIPHALRTLIAAPVYQILTAIGIVSMFDSIKNKSKQVKYASVVLMFLFFTISVWHYLYQYYFIYPKLYSRDWQYGYKEVVSYIKDHQNEYDEVVFSRHYGEPHMFTLFFLGYDPRGYQNNTNLIRFETFNWVRVLRFDKYYFPDLGDQGTQYEDIIKSESGKRLLLIGRPGDFPSNKPRLKTIYFLNKDEAFDIVEKI